MGEVTWMSREICYIWDSDTLRCNIFLGSDICSTQRTVNLLLVMLDFKLFNILSHLLLIYTSFLFSRGLMNRYRTWPKREMVNLSSCLVSHLHKCYLVLMNGSRLPSCSTTVCLNQIGFWGALYIRYFFSSYPSVFWETHELHSFRLWDGVLKLTLRI